MVIQGSPGTSATRTASYPSPTPNDITVVTKVDLKAVENGFQLVLTTQNIQFSTGGGVPRFGEPVEVPGPVVPLGLMVV